MGMEIIRKQSKANSRYRNKKEIKLVPRDIVVYGYPYPSTSGK
jgi:hypothetical protein